ncbi:hypothetical protein [Uliginosibacterium gangwonense]|uniref:hypothetical protein n=1 Tax=Uliginosibacterium gangwonense TaxID=392736 RepID=UPI00036A3A98|nr:hypothetical protein [Uliginosibacterium gangwonense]
MGNQNKIDAVHHADESGDDAPAIDPSLLLALFGQKPIVFHRLYIDITGSCSAALWLAYALNFIEEEGTPPSEWWSKSQQAWTDETGLSRREQEGARKRLRLLGILEERPQRNAPLLYRIDAQRLHALMQHYATELASSSGKRKQGSE